MSKEIKDPADEIIQKQRLVSLRRLAEFRKGLDVLSTGIFALDMACGEIDLNRGNGGIKARKIVEIAGENNCFKSGITEQMMKETLNRYPGKCVAVVYSEPPNEERLEDLGIDIDRVIPIGCYHPDIDKRKLLAEEALDTLIDFAKLPSIKLCIIDSLGSLAASKQIFDDKNKEKDLYAGSTVAATANVVNNFLKKWKIQNELAILLIVNQEKEQIKTGFGSSFIDRPITRLQTPGGRGMEFDADFRIRVTGSPDWDDKQHSYFQRKLQKGIKIDAQVFKCKYGHTMGCRPAKFVFNFKTKRIDNEEKVLAYAAQFGYKRGDDIISPFTIPVAQGGAWYYINGKKFNGMDNAIEYLIENPEIVKSLSHEVMQRHNEFFEDNFEIDVEEVLNAKE